MWDTMGRALDQWERISLFECCVYIHVYNRPARCSIYLFMFLFYLSISLYILFFPFYAAAYFTASI